MKAFLPFAWDRLPIALASMRKSFYCAEIFETVTLDVARPARPDFLLFTSQNAVRSYLALGWGFEGVVAHCVGAKTLAIAQSAGLRACLLGPPPAAAQMANVPDGQGLWLSGTEIAQPLPIARLPIYRRSLDYKMAEETVAILHSYKIRNMLVTSEQVAQWAGRTDLCIEGAAVLSSRLAAAANRHLPDLTQLWTVPDFESGVRTLYASPIGD